MLFLVVVAQAVLLLSALFGGNPARVIDSTLALPHHPVLQLEYHFVAFGRGPLDKIEVAGLAVGYGVLYRGSGGYEGRRCLAASNGESCSRMPAVSRTAFVSSAFCQVRSSTVSEVYDDRHRQDDVAVLAAHILVAQDVVGDVPDELDMLMSCGFCTR